jgi:hypothetical protein
MLVPLCHHSIKIRGGYLNEHILDQECPFREGL